MFDAWNFLVEDPQTPCFICVPPSVKRKPTPLDKTVRGVNCPFNRRAWHAPEEFGNMLFFRCQTFLEFPCYDLRLRKAASVSINHERSDSPGRGEIALLIQCSCFMYWTLKKWQLFHFYQFVSLAWECSINILSCYLKAYLLSPVAICYARHVIVKHFSYAAVILYANLIWYTLLQ